MGQTEHLATSDAKAAPIEWVAGNGAWWVVRLAVPVAFATPFAAYLAWYLVQAWHGVDVGVATPFGPFIALVPALVIPLLFAEWYLFSRFPSVRAIGISPSGLRIDFGVRQHFHPWADVRAIVRTSETSYRGSGSRQIVRTTIRLGSGLDRQSLGLSENQAVRLSSFLRLA